MPTKQELESQIYWLKEEMQNSKSDNYYHILEKNQLKTELEQLKEKFQELQNSHNLVLSAIEKMQNMKS